MLDILKELENKIIEAIDHLKEEFSGLRGGRPNSKLVENIMVDYFGQKLTIKQLGSISIIPPREIHISVWDKNAAPPVLKAIEASNLNVGVLAEGNLVRINLPPLSGERRQELIKIAKREIEETKVRIRNGRDEINKEIGKLFDKKEITEDDKFKLKDKVQEQVNQANEKIEKILEDKIKEIEE
ncbi:ribosome recycling factor [Candidatus Wolfebacteria bacterium]|nr:ribosome recycling factor [Candidatus Wolfebacteria bacterium]